MVSKSFSFGQFWPVLPRFLHLFSGPPVRSARASSDVAVIILISVVVGFWMGSHRTFPSAGTLRSVATYPINPVDFASGGCIVITQYLSSSSLLPVGPTPWAEIPVILTNLECHPYRIFGHRLLFIQVWVYALFAASLHAVQLWFNHNLPWEIRLRFVVCTFFFFIVILMLLAIIFMGFPLITVLLKIVWVSGISRDEFTSLASVFTNIAKGLDHFVNFLFWSSALFQFLLLLFDTTDSSRDNIFFQLVHIYIYIWAWNLFTELTPVSSLRLAQIRREVALVLGRCGY